MKQYEFNVLNINYKRDSDILLIRIIKKINSSDIHTIRINNINLNNTQLSIAYIVSVLNQHNVTVIINDRVCTTEKRSLVQHEINTVTIKDTLLRNNHFILKQSHFTESKVSVLHPTDITIDNIEEILTSDHSLDSSGILVDPSYPRKKSFTKPKLVTTQMYNEPFKVTVQHYGIKHVK